MLEYWQKSLCLWLLLVVKFAFESCHRKSCTNVSTALNRLVVFLFLFGRPNLWWNCWFWRLLWDQIRLLTKQNKTHLLSKGSIDLHNMDWFECCGLAGCDEKKILLLQGAIWNRISNSAHSRFHHRRLFSCNRYWWSNTTLFQAHTFIIDEESALFWVKIFELSHLTILKELFLHFLVNLCKNILSSDRIFSLLVWVYLSSKEQSIPLHKMRKYRNSRSKMQYYSLFNYGRHTIVLLQKF